MPFFNLLVIRSADMDRSARFYSELGLSFKKHAHGTGPEHYSAEVGGLVFEIYPLTEKSPPTHGVRIGFGVGDVDAAVLALEKQGAKVVSPAQNSEWGRRAVLADLDGHKVELTAPIPLPK